MVSIVRAGWLVVVSLSLANEKSMHKGGRAEFAFAMCFFGRKQNQSPSLPPHRASRASAHPSILGRDGRRTATTRKRAERQHRSDAGESAGGCP